MTATHQIIIDGELPPSANTWERWHWRTRAATKRNWIEFCKFLGGREIPPATPGEIRTVQIHLDMGPRGKHDDAGNRDYRSKVILDAMVDLQLLHDDDPRHLVFEGVTQTAPTHRKRTVITITTNPQQEPHQ